jgi:hypothetical protein
LKVAAKDLAIARALCDEGVLDNFADREQIVICAVKPRKHQTDRGLSIFMAGQTQSAAVEEIDQGWVSQH